MEHSKDIENISFINDGKLLSVSGTFRNGNSIPTVRFHAYFHVRSYNMHSHLSSQHLLRSRRMHWKKMKVIC